MKEKEFTQTYTDTITLRPFNVTYCLKGPMDIEFYSSDDIECVDALGIDTVYQFMGFAKDLIAYEYVDAACVQGGKIIDKEIEEELRQQIILMLAQKLMYISTEKGHS